MAKSGGDKKVANSLVAVSCAAVLAVYSAGYSRTRAAASHLEAQSAERRPAPNAAVAVPQSAVEPTASPSEPIAVVRTVETPVVAAPAHVAPAATAVEPTNVPAAVVTPAPAEIAPLATLPAPVQQVAPVTASVVAPAPSPVPVAASAPPPPPAPPAPKWKDGTYTGWGSSRHGDIQAAVVIEGGRIQGATIAQCLTRYSCDVIDRLPPQVAQRQSADVDYVSRATESANAFYYAVVDALNKATPPAASQDR
jgi:uncharacterized protein with FMN-binding domain